MTGALQSIECEEVVGNINTTTSGLSPWVSSILWHAENDFTDEGYPSAVGDVDVVFIDH